MTGRVFEDYGGADTAIPGIVSDSFDCFMDQLGAFADKGGAAGVRRDFAEDFSRLKARRCTAMAWIFIPAYCFAIP